MENTVFVLNFALSVFAFLETANVIVLYFAPGFKYGNGINVFDGYYKVKSDPLLFLFVRYLKNWVAGSKLVFIALTIVIILFADVRTKLFALIGLALSITSYFFGLHPIIKKLDKMGEITPRGYSRSLGFMIWGFIALFIVCIVYFILS